MLPGNVNHEKTVLGGKVVSCIQTGALRPSVWCWFALQRKLYHSGWREKSESALFNKLVNHQRAAHLLFTVRLGVPIGGTIVGLRTITTLPLLTADKEGKAFTCCCLKAAVSYLGNHRYICLYHPIPDVSPQRVNIQTLSFQHKNLGAFINQPFC